MYLTKDLHPEYREGNYSKKKRNVPIKMGKRLEQTLHKRRYPKGSSTHGPQESARYNPETLTERLKLKILRAASSGKNVKQPELSDISGGRVTGMKEAW